MYEIVGDLMQVMTDVCRQDPTGKFFVFAVKMFFLRYAEGAYYDASVWARRLGEVYCYFTLSVFGQDGSWLSLKELQWELPEWVWKHTAYRHAAAYGEDWAHKMIPIGIHLSSRSIYHDLENLRWYGNDGSHVLSFLGGWRMEADERVVLSVIRVSISFTSWYRYWSKL